MSSLIIGRSLADTFHRRVAYAPQRTAMLRKRRGQWTPLTWKEYETRAHRIGAALLKEGIKKGDRVAILSQGRPEWSFADLGILCVGAVTVPVYPSLTADDVHFILQDSGAQVLFVEDAVQVEKLQKILPQLPQLRRVLSFDDRQSSEGLIDSFRSWAGDLSEPDETSLKEWRLLSASLGGEDVASIVYTSGTSGVPKGVVLTHGNFLSFVESSVQTLGLSDQDTTLLFLPLAHILGRCEQMIALGCGWTNAYAESLRSLMENLAEVRPTVLVSVPRIYEKIYAAALAKVGSGPKALRERLLTFSAEYSRLLEQGRRPMPLQWLEHRAFDRFVYAKIRERFGGRIRFCISGGAPFSQEISRFFHAADVLILEGYGLTETTGPVTVNRPSDFRVGSVGTVLPVNELKLADDGEILVRGGTIFKGYYGQAEASAAMDKDSWFATGDVGVMDAQGFLSITDRKKDLIITAGAKNIAPQKLEGMLSEDPLFSQAVVFGDGQKFLVALLSVQAQEAQKLARQAGLTNFDSANVLYQDEGFLTLVQSRLDQVNARLSPFETIKKFRILPRELSVEAGELTPSLKVKRQFCAQKYSDLLEEMYR